jgi:hypothetical protein
MDLDKATPLSAQTLRDKLAAARERSAAMQSDRQQLSVPVLKDRLQRRDQLTRELTEIASEIASLSDAIPLVEAEERLTRRNADRQQQERLSAELVPVFDGLTRDRDDHLAALSNKPVATVEDLRQLRELGRQCEDMRSVLFAATNDGRFAQSQNPIDRLERVYREQHRQRERNFVVLRTPVTPRLALPDRPELTRLRALVDASRAASQ